MYRNIYIKWIGSSLFGWRHTQKSLSHFFFTCFLHVWYFLWMRLSFLGFFVLNSRLQINNFRWKKMVNFCERNLNFISRKFVQISNFTFILCWGQTERKSRGQEDSFPIFSKIKVHQSLYFVWRRWWCAWGY